MDHGVPTRRDLLGVSLLTASVLAAPALVGEAFAQGDQPSSGEKKQTKWSLSGDYFENCSCGVPCPCVISSAPPLWSRPTEGDCHAVFLYHIDKGAYGDVKLDGLNTVISVLSQGPMANGNWTTAAYLDERADEKQTEALGAIFGGTAGGPMAAVAPLIGKNLGVKKVPIAYKIDGKVRSGEIPGVLSMSVRSLASFVEGEEIWISAGIAQNPSKVALAVGRDGSTYADHGLHWDNSGRNGFYAAINWSN
jgi:hypothetical protein